MTTSSITQTETASAAKARLKPQKKIAVLGCGKMGTILLESFLERKLITAQEATATVQHGERSHGLSRELGGVFVGTDNRAAVAGAEIVLLCVKPQVLGQLVESPLPLPPPRVSSSKSWARTFRWSGPCPTRRPWWAPP